MTCIFFFSSRRRHTRSLRDWSSDVCSSDLAVLIIRKSHDGAAFHRDDTGSLACRTDPSVRAPLRLAGGASPRGKISHSLPILSGGRDRLKPGGAPPFSSADRALRINLERRWPPKKIVTPTAALRSPASRRGLTRSRPPDAIHLSFKTTGDEHADDHEHRRRRSARRLLRRRRQC